MLCHCYDNVCAYTHLLVHKLCCDTVVAMYVHCTYTHLLVHRLSYVTAVAMYVHTLIYNVCCTYTHLLVHIHKLCCDTVVAMYVHCTYTHLLVHILCYVTAVAMYVHTLIYLFIDYVMALLWQCMYIHSSTCFRATHHSSLEQHSPPTNGRSPPLRAAHLLGRFEDQYPLRKTGEHTTLLRVSYCPVLAQMDSVSNYSIGNLFQTTNSTNSIITKYIICNMQENKRNNRGLVERG